MPARLFPATLVALVFLVSAAPLPVAAADERAPTRPSRFSMSPADGGFVRLDTETGAMSFCQRKDGQWACADMDDTSAATRKRNEDLVAENKALREDIRRLEELLGLGDKPAPQGPATGPRFQLPSEEDVDKAMTYLERMLKKFREKLKQLEQDERPGGTPL